MRTALRVADVLIEGEKIVQVKDKIPAEQHTVIDAERSVW